MSSLNVEEDLKWVPTHVQVTVLRGRGLRGKGKHGTSDVYTIIQLGKEKYSTCVVEKTTEPEWKEECTFELQPSVLQSGSPVVSNQLVLTVMHQAVIGLDVFLGQAVIQLDKIFHESRCLRNEWYRLKSKTGKKEKERGDIQVTVQFTRDNLTASMFDLVMKDKGTSTFSKLKERMRMKRKSNDEDSSSAILPGGYGSLCRMRQRLPSDGGGEEDYEDDEGGEVRRSKMRTFFLRGKLRKSSDTRSSTSLGSESSESSSRGGSLSPTAGISVVVSDLSNSPSNSSNLTTDNSPEHTANLSPKSSSSLKCEFGDEAGEITIAVPQTTAFANGSHAYIVQPLAPGSGKPPKSLSLGLLPKSLPLSMSLQNLSPRASTDLQGGPVGDGRRWSFDKPGEEEKAAIAAALEQSGPMLDEDDSERLGQAAATKETESQGKKQWRNLFSHERSDSTGKRDGSEQTPAATEEKHKGRFGSKDSHSKSSLVVSPKLETSTYFHSPPLISNHPTCPPVHSAPLVSSLHHTNPFFQSQSTPPPISPCNPFFSLLQHNPFYEDMLISQPLKPLLPPLPYLSSSRPPISHLFPQTSNPNLTPTHNNPVSVHSSACTDAKSELMVKIEERPLPPAPTEMETRLGTVPSNPFISAGGLEPDSEWDDFFETFAAGRLQPLEDLTTDGKAQPNASDNVVEHCNHNGTSRSITQEASHGYGLEARKVTNQLTNTNMFHFDTFAQFLETIPEHTSLESDLITSDTSANSLKLAACNENNQTTSNTNTDYLINTDTNRNPQHTSSVKPSSSSPEPSSSGIGSSVEDFHSCLSSHSDKFSASSSEETEAHSLEKNFLSYEKSRENDRSNDLSLFDKDQNTIIQCDGSIEKVHKNDLETSLLQQCSMIIHQEPAITARESSALPNHSGLQPTPNKNGEKEIGEFSLQLGDFPDVLTDFSLPVRDTTDAIIASTPDESHPSFHIITSSPDVKQVSSDLPVERTTWEWQDTSQHSPIPFGLLPSTGLSKSPSQRFDSLLLHTLGYDHSSFVHSLYLSTDTQNYQTCESHLSSKCSSSSEPNDTLHSVNSTLCVELRHIQMTGGAMLEDFADACKLSNDEINQTDQFEPTYASPQPCFTTGNGCSLEVLPAASTDSYMSCSPRKLKEGDAERLHMVSDEMFSKHVISQGRTQQHSHSEGTLMPSTDELLLPSLRSDPVATQEGSSSGVLPSLSSSAPPLTPDCNSFPVALCSLPPYASDTVRSPPSMPRAVTPKPVPQEGQPQQAANQQNSPHPVKPLSTATLAEDKRTEGRSVLATRLEKLKFNIHPGRSSQLSEQEADKKSTTEGAGSYYHLNHSELVALLVQREAELERQKKEFEQQKCLLAKREGELKKLKPQVRDLEDYIDTLLVRIMEQKPTLLQVRSKFK